MPIVGDVLVERYRIDDVLGAGGMSSVYRATDLRLDRQVALKVLLPNLARDASLAGRFDREARMLAAVGHPSVAAIFDVEPGDPATGREPFYVMELCDGGSLADRIVAAGALDPEELVPIVAAIAEGLAALHAAGIIHRDVKPGNILFAGGGPTGGGRPKLADFGIAKSDGAADATTLTAPGTLVGTLPYLAPELLGGGAPTKASDVYALGATAFHALAGRLPKPFDSLGSFVEGRSTPPPPVSSARPDLGTAFDVPIAAALATDPGARPTAEAFATDVHGALEAHASEAPTRAPVPRPTPGASESPTLVLPLPKQASPVTAHGPLKPAAPITRPARVARGPGIGSTTQIVLAVAIVLLVLAFLALTGLPGIGIPVTSPLASPLPSATASPSIGPTQSPAAAPTADPAAAALDALNAVSSAIDQARGGKDGLTGGDAHELQTLADQVGADLRAGDFGAAGQAAATLQDRADKLTRKIDPQRRDALLSAIHDLRAAIPGG